MNATEQTAVEHYLGKGLTKDVAVGIVAVLMAESSLNPGSQGVQSTETPGALNPSGAYGIASWNGPRQAVLSAFATKKGLNPADLTTQLDFVLTEAANSYPTMWAAIRDTSTTYSVMITEMVDTYEIPADKPGEISRAMAFAIDMYSNTFTPSLPPAGAPVIVVVPPVTTSPVTTPPTVTPPTVTPASNPPVMNVAMVIQTIQMLTNWLAENAVGKS